ncbi:hypothetical protein [Paenibacillus sp. GYB003]|uniref:hypothetical protein n=1 Tax=Paenibacillus sp. GYB003 TaxID=2994392 RepID=UPI002F9618C7
MGKHFYKIIFISIITFIVLVSCENSKPIPGNIGNEKYSSLKILKVREENLDTWSIEFRPTKKMQGWYFDLDIKYLQKDKVEKLQLEAMRFKNESIAETFQEGFQLLNVKMEGAPSEIEIHFKWWIDGIEYRGSKIYEVEWGE